MIEISNNSNNGNIIVKDFVKKKVFDISNFKLEIGIPVWSYLHGKGIIIDNKSGYKVKFNNSTIKFTINGKLSENDLNPILFLDEDYLIEILKLKKNQIQEIFTYARFLISK